METTDNHHTGLRLRRYADCSVPPIAGTQPSMENALLRQPRLVMLEDARWAFERQNSGAHSLRVVLKAGYRRP